MDALLPKLLWILLSPLNVIFIILAAGVLLYVAHKRVGRALMAAGILFFLVLGLLPIGPLMLSSLENRYERPHELPQEVDGIIILGGIFDINVSQSRGSPVTYRNADRAIEGIRLINQYPEARLIFSGGNGYLTQNHMPEADIFQVFANRLGVSNDRLILERDSRNTYENIQNTMSMIQPEDGQRWILITSAFHMPRAMALVKASGWPGAIIAFPTDYQTGRTESLLPGRLDVLGNFSGLALGLREYIAILHYRINGRI